MYDSVPVFLRIKTVDNSPALMHEELVGVLPTIGYHRDSISPRMPAHEATDETKTQSVFDGINIIILKRYSFPLSLILIQRLGELRLPVVLEEISP